jgi:hypothetical protein
MSRNVFGSGLEAGISKSTVLAFSEGLLLLHWWQKREEQWGCRAREERETETEGEIHVQEIELTVSSTFI